MAVRICNQKYSHKTLGLSTPAWRAMLRLALGYGWQPMGGVIPDHARDAGPVGLSLADWDRWQGGDFFEEDQLWDGQEAAFTLSPAEAVLETYLPFQPESQSGPAASKRLVLFEDALNLVDALDRAYQAYEPVKVPASYFLFEPDDPALRLRPSLGALAAAIEICRQGSFSIEPWRYHL